MKCKCGKNIYRINKWQLCFSCCKRKIEEYWKQPNQCSKCDKILYMRNDSGLCSKHKHSEYIKEYIKRSERLEKELEVRREYKKRNRVCINRSQREREKIDINFKLKRRLRHRLYMATKNHYKSGSAVKDLGCSIEDFRNYLENQFNSDMNWENYGKKWDIDHIIPLISFDLTDPIQLKEACRYSNLQPILKRDHYVKSKLDLSKRGDYESKNKGLIKENE